MSEFLTGNDPQASGRGKGVLPILVNRDGGSASAAGDGLAATLEAACRSAGIAADVRLLAAAEIEGAVASCADRPIVAVGGGDGTLRSAASTLIRLGSNAALGILPLGTHNHLARQLDIPLDLPAAVALLASPTERRIDVGKAGDLLFLNNASIGIYPLLVRSREEERRRHGFPKWLANILAAGVVLRRLRHHLLSVEANGRSQTIRTPLLFVGNNVYSLEAGRIGQRLALDEGKLSLFALTAHSRLSALRFAARTLIGRADMEQDFATVEVCQSLVVNAHAETVHVALDGELQRLTTPLRFASLPGALKVIARPQHDENDEEIPRHHRETGPLS